MSEFFASILNGNATIKAKFIINEEQVVKFVNENLREIIKKEVNDIVAEKISKKNKIIKKLRIKRYSR